MPSQTRSLTGFAWRRPALFAVLTAASVAFTLAFACATPFAGFGAAAVLFMPRRDALLAVGAAWLANQGVGFAALHYPWTAECFGWGLALGAVALFATLGAAFAAARLKTFPGAVAATAAFLSAFAIYEGLLFLITLAVHGGFEAYAPAVIARIFALNAAAFAGLLAMERLGFVSAFLAKPDAVEIAVARIN